MNILFLDQSGQLGGAELCLSDLAAYYRDTCLVCTFAPGPFPQRLSQQQIAVDVLANRSLNFQKQSGLEQAVKSLRQLWPLISQVVRLSADYDCLYANTQKALVVGAIASLLSRKPLIYHLHDIISLDHFSSLSRRIIVTLANRASLVIANSKASQSAFIESGGRAELTQVVYNGFDMGEHSPKSHRGSGRARSQLRDQLGLTDRFVVGHFSRLSPWKGQHVLIEALQHCPPQVTAILVGDALFGENEYAVQLRQQIERLGLGDHVKFLGFRSDIPALMSACDLVAHTSVTAEPFGRVIVEGMLAERPVVAAAAGGALEIIEPGKTGWLTAPGDADELARAIAIACEQPELRGAIAHRAYIDARQRFDLKSINNQLDNLISTALHVGGKENM